MHDHAHYFVDSLWDHCEVLQDWSSVTNLLLDPKTSFVMSDEETRTIIEIMVCAARRAAGATPPAGRARNKVCVRYYHFNCKTVCEYRTIPIRWKLAIF